MTPITNIRAVSRTAGIVILLTVVATVLYTGNISFTSTVKLNEPLFPPSAYCSLILNMTRQKRTYVSVPIDPPWTYLLANYSSTIAANKNLYLWPCLPRRKRRFGNQLFNFAAVFGVAWRNKRIPLWPSRQTLVSAFQHRLILEKKLQLTELEKHQMVLHEQGPGIYDNRTENLAKKNVCLADYTQSFKYFDHVEDQLRVDLKFKPSILAVARKWLEKVTPERWRGMDFVRVVLHVRRGDYAYPNLARRGWTQPTPRYFRRAKSYFTNCLERVQFIVLSDDMRWCIKHLSAPNVVFATGHSPTVDLAIASLCDHAIVTIGSFGWWAAWLANGVTVTNKDVPRPYSPLTRRFHREDYYKTDWIAL